MNPQSDQTVALESAALASGSSQSGPVLQAFKEFCDRHDRGELIDPDAYCQEFPSIRGQLANMIHACLFLEENPALLGDVSAVPTKPAIAPCTFPKYFPKIGQCFLGFRLLEELGQGSFAKVFLAEEVDVSDRPMAVKIAQKGRAEAGILGPLKHINIVPVYSVKDHLATGLSAICMPFEGRATLCQLLKTVRSFDKLPVRADVVLQAVREASRPNDPLTPRSGPADVLKTGTYVDGIRLLGAQLADALAYIHDLGICHRDMKPSNVLLNPVGVPMLLDFNLSADAAKPPPKLGGSFPYMAPEQLRAFCGQNGNHADSLDGKADIYSLGVILYELLAGCHPYGSVEVRLSNQGWQCQELIEKQQRGPVPIRSLNPDIDRDLADLLHGCLAWDPGRRPKSAAELAQRLRKGLSSAQKTRSWFSRHKIAMTIMAALVLSAAIGAAMVNSYLPPPEEREFTAAQTLYQRGKFPEAIAKYKKVLDLNPLDARAYFARARAYQEMGHFESINYKLALDDYEDAQRLAPGGHNLACMGYCCNLLNRPEEALGFYTEAIKAGFRSAEMSNNLGYTLYLLGRHTEARSYLDEAVSQNARLQQAFHNRAVINFHSILSKITELDLRKNSKRLRNEIMGEVDRSMNYIETAQRLGPSSAQLSFDAACLYGMAMRLDPKWADHALTHLNAALQQGLDRSVLDQLRGGPPSFFDLLKENARFRELISGPIPSGPAIPLRRVVDPMIAFSR